MGKGGAVDVRVGSGLTGVGGNAQLVSGQTMGTGSDSKSGGRVTISAGTGGQTGGSVLTGENEPGYGAYSEQQHLRFRERPLVHDHARTTPDALGPGHAGQTLTALAPGGARESDSKYGPYSQ